MLAASYKSSRCSDGYDTEGRRASFAARSSSTAARRPTTSIAKSAASPNRPGIAVWRNSSNAAKANPTANAARRPRHPRPRTGRRRSAPRTKYSRTGSPLSPPAEFPRPAGPPVQHEDQAESHEDDEHGDVEPYPHRAEVGLVRRVERTDDPDRFHDDRARRIVRDPGVERGQARPERDVREEVLAVVELPVALRLHGDEPGRARVDPGEVDDLDDDLEVGPVRVARVHVPAELEEGVGGGAGRGAAPPRGRRAPRGRALIRLGSGDQPRRRDHRVDDGDHQEDEDSVHRVALEPTLPEGGGDEDHEEGREGVSV